ncbi:MAG: DUF370 domain-containing protein [Firmicutes bacterium]|nr:DUF370 domain-containing protein [Bacillota bacterium]
MFIHLGGDKLINSKSLVAILNADSVLGANSSKEFLKTAQEEGFIANLDQEEYKSIVITDKDIYLSPISSLTLRKRADFVDNLSE